MNLPIFLLDEQDLEILMERAEEKLNAANELAGTAVENLIECKKNIAKNGMCYFVANFEDFYDAVSGEPDALYHFDELLSEDYEKYVVDDEFVESYMPAKPSNIKEREKYLDTVEAIIGQLKDIRDMAEAQADLLDNLHIPLLALGNNIHNLIDNHGDYYDSYSTDLQERIKNSVEMVQQIKDLMDKPLQNNDGSLNPENMEAFENAMACLPRLQSAVIAFNIADNEARNNELAARMAEYKNEE